MPQVSNLGPTNLTYFLHLHIIGVVVESPKPKQMLLMLDHKGAINQNIIRENESKSTKKMVEIPRSLMIQNWPEH